MKYYTLNSKGTEWEESKKDPTKRTITLYNDDFTVKGIGQYGSNESVDMLREAFKRADNTYIRVDEIRGKTKE